MHPEDKKLLKRVVLTTGFVLLMGVGIVGPCISDATVHQESSSATECDASCPLPKPAGAPAPVTEVITADNWQFTLPSNDWRGRNIESPNDEIKVIRLSPEPNSVMALFIKEPLDTETLADYAVESIKDFDQLGYQLNSVKQFPLNDNRFVLTQMNKNDRVIWNWLTVKDGFGYVFACGGDINADAGTGQHDLCFAVAQTVQIK